uniref:Uncharacterized protein n=1 Tax=Rhizophora mucronata TaxID=61149 RepID=A0A2P2Q7S3_RHIMU
MHRLRPTHCKNMHKKGVSTHGVPHCKHCKNKTKYKITP